MVGAGHGIWGASDDYSMPTFAPELANRDTFRHPRAMVVVWVALHVPVQVLPHGLFLRRPAVTILGGLPTKVLLNAIPAPRDLRPY